VPQVCLMQMRRSISRRASHGRRNTNTADGPRQGLSNRPAALSVCSTGARHVLLLTVKNLLFPATLGALVGGIGTSLIETRRAGTDDALPAFFATGGVASELPSVPTGSDANPAELGRHIGVGESDGSRSPLTTTETRPKAPLVCGAFSFGRLCCCRLILDYQVPVGIGRDATELNRLERRYRGGRGKPSPTPTIPRPCLESAAPAPPRRFPFASMPRADSAAAAGESSAQPCRSKAAVRAS
jgi:hypothetical protein